MSARDVGDPATFFGHRWTFKVFNPNGAVITKDLRSVDGYVVRITPEGVYVDHPYDGIGNDLDKLPESAPYFTFYPWAMVTTAVECERVAVAGMIGPEGDVISAAQYAEEVGA